MSSTVIGTAWTLLAADVSALEMVHCHHDHNRSGRLVLEVMTGASLPDESEYGVTVLSGKSLYGDGLAAIGTGKLYGRGQGEAVRAVILP